MDTAGPACQRARFRERRRISQGGPDKPCRARGRGRGQACGVVPIKDSAIGQVRVHLESAGEDFAVRRDLERAAERRADACGQAVFTAAVPG